MTDKPFLDRFNAKWVENRESGCWDWIAAKAGKGYGEIKATKSRRYLYAHRVSWEMANGPLPAGMSVLHRCDNPGCVNPAHLFIGSSADNAQDMAAKDRHLKGERNTQSKLTEQDILKIYQLSDGGMVQHRIAKLVGVGQMTVCRILRGERWRHVFESQRRGK